MSDEIELKFAWDETMPAAHRSRVVLEDLLGRHRQAHRRYHGVRHVVWVLRHARELSAAIPACSDASADYDADAVTAAAFFHDAIYDPTRHDNEARSAELAERQLVSLGWDRRRAALVGDLVRATASHLGDESPDAATAERLECQVLLDADLAVLGSEPNAYAAYVNGVRSEYGDLDEAAWSTRRAAVLTGLLAKPQLYVTEPARQWWQARARANLTAELATLRARA